MVHLRLFIIRRNLVTLTSFFKFLSTVGTRDVLPSQILTANKFVNYSSFFIFTHCINLSIWYSWCNSFPTESAVCFLHSSIITLLKRQEIPYHIQIRVLDHIKDQLYFGSKKLQSLTILDQNLFLSMHLHIYFLKLFLAKHFSVTIKGTAGYHQLIFRPLTLVKLTFCEKKSFFS